MPAGAAGASETAPDEGADSGGCGGRRLVEYRGRRTHVFDMRLDAERVLGQFDPQGCIVGIGHRLRDRGLHLVDFGAQLVELGLARHVVKAAAELIGHGARAAGPLAHLAHQLGQILGTHHNQRNDQDDEKLAPGDIEHMLLSLSWPAPYRGSGPPSRRGFSAAPNESYDRLDGPLMRAKTRKGLFSPA